MFNVCPPQRPTVLPPGFGDWSELPSAEELEHRRLTMSAVPLPPEIAKTTSTRRPFCLECQVDTHDLHPYHAASAPTQNQLRQSPLHIRSNPLAMGAVNQTVAGSCDPQQEVAYNQGKWVPFETDRVEGRIFIAIKGCPGSNQEVFLGKKRFTHVVVQTRYKRAVRADSLVVGQHLIKAPPPHMAKTITRISDFLMKIAASRLSSTIKVSADWGFMCNPCLSTCQVINVSRPGEEPSDPLQVEEDMRLWEPSLTDSAGGPMPSQARRRWCDKPANLEGKVLGTDLVFTWVQYQDVVDFSTYRMNLGLGMSIDIAPVLCSQPLSITHSDYYTGDHIFSFLLWHEKLLRGQDHEQDIHSLGGTLGLGGAMSSLTKHFGRFAIRK